MTDLPYKNTLSDEDIAALSERILSARGGPALNAETVIAACDKLSREMSAPEYLELLIGLGLSSERAGEELRTAMEMMSADYLRSRVRRELGGLAPEIFTPEYRSFSVRQERRPLGVLLHISAGNVDALPAFSVIEGLLTGNINLLKLPREDNGLSAAILERLIDIEPRLEPFVEVFDVPSDDVASLRKLSSLADAVVVWGGDEAVMAVRSLARPDMRVIEWGHRLSFAYAELSADDEAIYGIAYNMLSTDQLYCSSCQGIYVDTDDFDETAAFAERLSKILNETAKRFPEPDDRISARITLEAHTERLESIDGSKRVFKSGRCCAIAYRDRELTRAYGFGSCWVKPLPREMLLRALLPHKGRLQTVALACNEEERAHLTELLIRAGAVRVTDGRRMSEEYCGLPHDGELPLQRYTKVVSIEV